MRIGFDARMIDHPGIGRYISNLLNAMLALDTKPELFLFGIKEKLLAYNFPLPDDHIVNYTIPVYGWREPFVNPYKKYEPDILHIPHFNVPLFLTQEIKRIVVTIHDLIYLKFSESVPTSMKGIAIPHVILKTVERASKIIAVSENTKKDIIAEFPDSAGKIEVIYEAADPCFRKITDKRKLTGVKEKHNLPDKFILFVGSLKRHKNIERLIDAYIDLKSRGVRHRLVIVGRPREPEIQRKIESTDTLYLREVSTEDLVGIYNLATLLVIPSLYEGFGLPAIEAMACGIPVAASSTPSLQEVVGDAAVLFDPQDTTSISDKIHTILKNDGLRQELIEKGLKRASAFSWEETAKQTLELYRKI